MKKCLIRNRFSDFNFAELCGINILSGITPVVLNFQNEEIEGLEDSLSNRCIGNYAPTDEFTEINSEKCTIIFDLKNTYSPDRILVSSAYSPEYDIGLSNYELFISDSLDEMFERKNRITEYDNASNWVSGENRNGCDQIFDIDDYDGRYFAIKVNIPNPTDKIARISHIGLYNHELTEQLTFCEKNFGENVLRGKIPTAKGTYTADLSCLTDGICFKEDVRISLDTESSYTFKLDGEILADSFFIIGSDSAINNCTIYASNDKDKLFDSECQLTTSVFPKPTAHNGISAAVCMTDEPVSFSYIAFCFDKDVLIDQLGIMPLEVTIDEATNL